MANKFCCIAALGILKILINLKIYPKSKQIYRYWYLRKEFNANYRDQGITALLHCSISLKINWEINKIKDVLHNLCNIANLLVFLNKNYYCKLNKLRFNHKLHSYLFLINIYFFLHICKNLRKKYLEILFKLEKFTNTFTNTQYALGR